MKNGKPKTDITGKRYNHLIVLRFNHTNKYGKSLWLCRCDCGNEKLYQKWQLESGTVKGCGCLTKKHGLCHTRLHTILEDVKQRCLNSNNKYYSYYGGRGITICDEWRKDFKSFYDWAMANGYSDDLTIDRIDNNGNYEPKNCRWATRKEQQRNLRCNRWITHQGETHTFAEWSRILGIPPNTILLRANKNLPVEQILSTKHLARSKKSCRSSQ